MAHSSDARIHPTAVISADAKMAENVEVGPFVVIEGPVHLGPGCVVRPHAHLIGPLTMGRGNIVHSGAVLGDRPQHLRFAGQPSGVVIGEENTFREGVTVHAGTTPGHPTRIGNLNFFMANSHVAHDCLVANRCIFANGALLAGHCTLDDNVYLSGNSAVHQFVRIGRLALLSGLSITTKDLPCFLMQQGINCIVGVNVVGMRRAGLSSQQIDAVRHAFRIIFHEGQIFSRSLPQVERELGHVDVVAELVDFIRHSKRGINSTRDKGRGAAA
jgi:UDP-N-acetylglucosamine acyltransferase